MIVTYKTATDVVRRTPIPTIHAVQGDSYTREIEVEIFADGEPLLIPEEAVVCVRYSKPDKMGGKYDTLPDGTKAYSIEGNMVKVMFAPQMFTAAGNVFVQLEIIDGDNVLSTFSFKMFVEVDRSVNAIDSEQYFKITSAKAPAIWLAPNINSNAAYLDGISFGSLIGAQIPSESTVKENDVIICGGDMGFLYVNKITTLWGGAENWQKKHLLVKKHGIRVARKLVLIFSLNIVLQMAKS